MPDIFDEVADDLRSDRARLLVRRYAPLLLGVAVLVVGFAGGWRVWQYYDAKRAGEVAVTYMAAMKAANGKTTADHLAAAGDFAAIAEHAGSGYRTLARLHEAALKADVGDLAGASTVWDEIAGDRSADPLLRDLANLQWGLHQIDSGNPAAIEARLAPLAIATNPWHSLAAEALAILDLKRGKTDAARAELKTLSQDTTAPEGVRRRAEGLLDQLGSNG